MLGAHRLAPAQVRGFRSRPDHDCRVARPYHYSSACRLHPKHRIGRERFRLGLNLLTYALAVILGLEAIGCSCRAKR